MEARKESLDQLAARVLDLNVRYYRALGAATVDYVRSLVSFFGGQPLLRSALSRVANAAQTAAAVTLEGAAGETPETGFVVANRLTRRVSATFNISPIS